MRKKSLSVHSENILPIIKKWLYSNRDIFIRELVSNACDALQKYKLLSETQEPLEVHISIDAANRTITFSDNGIGMTEEEVEKYIAQIAFSGAEEFLATYKSESEKDPIIGHFGLGFYSAYMVAQRVEIQTLSMSESSTPVHWSCDGSSTYEVGLGVRKTRGTDIILHVDEQSKEYLEEARLRELLQSYCSFMSYPIILNNKPLQNKDPLWLKSPSDCTEQEYIQFYRSLYPLEQDPIFWIHLNVDYPFNLQGILYFPKLQRRLDPQEGTIRLYCNRVFVADHCRDILPDYLTALRGAIDSPDIPLNVSRSYLQVDQNVAQLGAHISKKVADRLQTLFKTDREKYVTYWPDIEWIAKLGALQDEKFYERIKDCLIWKTSTSSDATTLTEYLERAKEKKIYYAAEERSSPLQKAFLDKGIELLYLGAPIDSAVMNFLEDKMAPTTFQRVDAALDAALLDDSREKTLLDPDGKSEATRIADFIRSSLPTANLSVEAKSLSSDEIPAILLLDEKMRRWREYMQLTQGKAAPAFKENRTFVVNTNHKLVQTAWSLQHKQPKLAQDLVQHLYDLSLLAQKEFDATQLDATVQRAHNLVEQLVSQVVVS